MPRAALISLSLLLLLGGTAGAQRESGWRWTSGIGLRVTGAAGEIGRQPNATGAHEDLVARLGGGLSLVAQVGHESRYGGLELRLSWSGRAIEVRNEDGVRFPNHGEPPLAWTGSLMLYPLGPVSGKSEGAIQPFLTAGVGGLVLQLDLDNIEGQTLYHSFQWNLGAGLRILSGLRRAPWRTITFVDLRVERLRTWPNGPLHRFDILSGSVGLGMRF